MGQVTVNNGGILLLQSNSGNTSGGTANVLNYAGTGLNLNNGSVLQLRSDASVTFNGTNSIGALNNTTTTIDVDAVTPGTTNQVLTLMPNGSPIGGSHGPVTIDITGNTSSSAYSLATGVFTNVTNATLTFTLVPTTANVAVGGFASTQASASSVVLDGTATGNSIGVISNGTGTATTVTKQNTSTWTLTGSDTYTGATSVTNGMLGLSGTLAASNVTVNGEVAAFNETSSGVISGAATTFTLTNGAGTLGGVNSYAGATSVAAGSLAITGTLANTAVTVSGGTLTVASAGNLGTGNLNLSGATALVNLNSPQTIGTLAGTSGSLNLIGAGTSLTLSETASTTYAGAITGLGGLALGSSSNNTLTLSGTNSFSGGLSISAGTVQIGNHAAVTSPLGASSGTLSIGAASGSASTSLIFNLGANALFVRESHQSCRRVYRDGNGLRHGRFRDLERPAQPGA